MKVSLELIHIATMRVSPVKLVYNDTADTDSFCLSGSGSSSIVVKGASTRSPSLLRGCTSGRTASGVCLRRGHNTKLGRGLARRVSG